MSNPLIPLSPFNLKAVGLLLSNKKWIIFTLLITLAFLTSIRLGIWQYQRHEVRIEFNQTINQALAKQEVDLTSTDSSTLPWQKVYLTGSFDPASQLLVRRQYFEGKLGFWVVAKFITEDGRKILVNRGFTPVTAGAKETPEVLAINDSKLKIRGYLQPLAGESLKAPDIPLAQVSAVNKTQFNLSDSDYNFFIHQIDTDDNLKAITPPVLSYGPHLAYSLQWYAFAVMIIIGWASILRKELIEKLATKNQIS
jgi:cytochrome oxidase assembly protein ShyY1